MKKSRSQPGSEPGVRISLCLPAESYRQLEELASTFHVTRTSVITLALGRWYHQEPIVNNTTATSASSKKKSKKKKRRKHLQSVPFDLEKGNNGSNTSGVSNG